MFYFVNYIPIEEFVLILVFDSVSARVLVYYITSYQDNIYIYIYIRYNLSTNVLLTSKSLESKTDCLNII